MYAIAILHARELLTEAWRNYLLLSARGDVGRWNALRPFARERLLLVVWYISHCAGPNFRHCLLVRATVDTFACCTIWGLCCTCFTVPYFTSCVSFRSRHFIRVWLSLFADVRNGLCCMRGLATAGVGRTSARRSLLPFWRVHCSPSGSSR